MAASGLINERYRVVQRLGDGGEATVYLVEDRAAGGERRALKLVGILDAAGRARLAGEFARLCRVAHPHLVAVHDLETVSEDTADLVAGSLFFTADYVEGDDLIAHISRSPRTARAAAAIEIAEQIASALAQIHAAGFVHCDVKPANVVVESTAAGVHARLLDLGLSAARGVRGHARGTPAYMAPESLVGSGDPRSDLYSLGASLYHALAGAPPFGAEPVRALAAGDVAPPLGRTAPSVPPALAELIDRMLAPDPASRPSSAAVALDELDRVREALALPVRADRARPPLHLLSPELIGRDRAVAAIASALARLDDPSAPRLIRVVAPPGAGRHAVVEAAIRGHALATASGSGAGIEVLRGSTALALAAGSGGAELTDARAVAVRAAARTIAALAERAKARPVVVVLEPGDPDPRADALRRAAAARDPAITSAPVAIVSIEDEVQGGGDDARPGEEQIRLAPLAEPEIAALASSMLGRAVAPAFAADLATASGGLPRFAVEAIRAAAAAAGVDRADRVPVAELLGGEAAGELEPLVARRVAGLPAAQASLLECAAIAGGESPVAAIAAALEAPVVATYAAAGELAAAGFARLERDHLRLPSPVHARAIAGAMPVSRRRSLHRALATWHESQPEPDVVAVARHRLVAGPADRAARACLVAARELASQGRAREAVELADAAVESSTGAFTSEALVELAELAIAGGDYDRALRAAERAARSRDPDRRRRALLATALAHQRRGDLAAAEAALVGHLAEDRDDERAVGAYARLLVSRARYADAARVAGDVEALAALPPPLTAGRAQRLESAGLARLYTGDVAGADAAFSVLLAAAEASDRPVLVARALALRGMVAHMSGDVAAAAALNAQAGDRARAAGDIHAAAVCDLNQATAHAERGRFGLALSALGNALLDLRKLGDVAELAAALFNRGLALLALGEIDAARRAAAEALDHARTRGTPQMQLYAHLLAGDVARRDRDPARAVSEYEQALAAVEATGSVRDRLMAALNLAEALAERDDPRAREIVTTAAADVVSDDERDRLALSRARIELALGGDPGECAPELEQAVDRARRGGRINIAWRCEVVAARLAVARGEPERAAALAGAARATFEELCDDAPEARRQGLRTDPDAQALAAVEADLQIGGGPAAAPPRHNGHAGDRELRRLLALSRRLNSELRLEPLLDLVIDTAIELTSAERGFLLLARPGGGKLDIVVARNIDHAGLEGDDLRLSRSIAERAATAGEVVLTVDAAYDERFGGAESVAAMRLRSVLAVPLRQKGRITGTIYVDHRFRTGAFDDDAVELARELADIAAVAIENARLVEENRRRQEEIADLNRRLEQELGDREAELLTVRTQLGAERSDLRHSYDAIIGRSPRMLAMLRTLDRATEVALPIVIHGESGTGKELVARALHLNGPRRQAAFVAVNCGAVPEQLLESELFGHVRGAFTGADRDRRGLFETASSGTLFLDEVADTSLGMQAKLLRVLQEGEIRRVGDERMRRVDVRVIAASNRRLVDLVAASKFREDLFYRLNVLAIEVPPLRDRVEDIPPLAEHILARLAGQRPPPRLTRAAMARLCAHAWPGNVRELENELARAWALADRTIDVADLSPAIATAPAMPSAGDDRNLELKPRVEALERALVERALGQTGGNQSAAAKLLGLSRFGLQKKLRRYGV